MGGVRGRATDRPALGDPVIRGFPSAEASRMGMHGCTALQTILFPSFPGSRLGTQLPWKLLLPA